MNRAIQGIPAELLERSARIEASLDHAYWRYAWLLVLFVFTASLVRASRIKLWLDELFTLKIAELDSPAAIWNGLIEGCDGAPPLYALMAHFLLPLIPNDAVAIRLPAILGFCGMLIAILAFCRGRMPASYAFGACLLAANAVLYFATEARPYGVVLGFSAGALLCWQRIAVNAHRRAYQFGLAFCLSGAIAAHYYAIFLAVPLGLGEVVRWYQKRRIDSGTLLAFLAPAVVLAAHLPLIFASRVYQDNVWSPASLGQISIYYMRYFSPMLLLILPALLVGAVLRGREAPDDKPRFGHPEWVAVGVQLIIPVFVVVLSMFTTHVFVDRYVLWAVTGSAVVMGAAVLIFAKGQSAAGLVLLLTCGSWLAVREAAGVIRTHTLREGQPVIKALSNLHDRSQPVVVAHQHVFMELSYYVDPAIRPRLMYGISRELDLRYLHKDTGAKLLKALRRRTSLSIFELDEILGKYPRFILAALPQDYLQKHLAAVGYRVIPLHPSVNPVLFQVERR